MIARAVMPIPTLADLPPPPPGKTGFPWTEECPRLNDPGLPRVSIVTPSFNQGAYLEETLRSVLLQGYPNLEYIVIDGGSADQSVEIIRRYAPWLASWVSEPDRGQADAINKGLRASTGQVLNWINSDDGLLPFALHHVSAFLCADPRAQIVCGFRRKVIGTVRHPRRLRVHLPPDRYSLARLCYLAQETTFWTRAVWERVGELDITLQYALDFDLWQRMLAAGFQFELLPRFIGLFRAHPDSKGARWSDVRSAELNRIYQKYLGVPKSEIDLPVEISGGWWYRTIFLHQLARLGLLNNPGLARRIVAALTMPEHAVPSPTRAVPPFVNYWHVFE
jgi:glycosyltransferase involved in cell wall biosynthesis